MELVGTKVLGYLPLKDIVTLEGACGSKKSYPYRAAVELPFNKHANGGSLRVVCEKTTT